MPLWDSFHLTKNSGLNQGGICEFESHEAIDWESVYLLPFKCTEISKLIIFANWENARRNFRITRPQADPNINIFVEDRQSIKRNQSCN